MAGPACRPSTRCTISGLVVVRPPNTIDVTSIKKAVLVIIGYYRRYSTVMARSIVELDAKR